MIAAGTAAGPPTRPEWAGAVLAFAGGAVVVNLGEPVPAATRRALAALGLPGPFAVITPCNPRGMLLGPDANAGRLAAFTAEVESRGVGPVRAVGSDPAGTHSEPGLALAIPRQDAVALARRWEQLALYWWDGHCFWIVPVLAEGAPTPLPTGSSAAGPPANPG